ncbi:Nepenthesin [Bertholletia excelsa]
MEKRRKQLLTPPLMVAMLLFVSFSAIFEGYCTAANQQHTRKQGIKSKAADGLRSTVVFPLSGNVYPKGYYHVTLDIGNPPKPYFLDIDSGSDLTWLQCDAPCTKCMPAPHALYKPNKDLVTCQDPLCVTLQWPEDKSCDSPNEQCDYWVVYADQGSSIGVLLKDHFSLRFTNGSVIEPRLIFGCGYDQEVPESIPPPFTDGVLGLADGKSSIVSQLHDLGLTRNVLGHCLSRKGGFLFFGDDLIPSSGVVWMPTSNSLDKHYLLGPAELLYGRKRTGIKDLSVIFDSGSTYSYFNSNAYEATLSMIKQDLKGKQLKEAEDPSLPVCWTDAKGFKSIDDVKKYFKPMVLSFTKTKNSPLQLPPETYLIISDRGNVCLGILNGTEVGLKDLNIIGDISMQDKMVIYDNEKQQIGWVAANCDRLPNVDRDFIHGFCQLYASNTGSSHELCPQTHGFVEDL